MNRILAFTRFAVFVPAMASILGAILLMVQGSVAMVQVGIDVIREGTKLKLTIVEVLTAVDAILLGTVLLVIGYGLYELFIDEDLESSAVQILKEVEQMFTQTIKNEQIKGNLKNQTDPEILGRYLITFWCGLNTLRRMYPDKNVLKNQIEMQLAVIS